MSKIKKVFRVIIDELSIADDYSKDWFKYGKSQLAHFSQGLITAAMLSQLYFAVFGEFAEKGALWVVVTFGYFMFEMTRQGWQGWDTVEDWIFFSVYGAGLPIFLFHEVAPGSPELTINSQHIVPLFSVIIAHLLGGVISRVLRVISA